MLQTGRADEFDQTEGVEPELTFIDYFTQCAKDALNVKIVNDPFFQANVAERYAKLKQIEMLQSLRKELEQNDEYFDERMISSRIEKLEDSFR